MIIYIIFINPFKLTLIIFAFSCSVTAQHFGQSMNITPSYIFILKKTKALQYDLTQFSIIHCRQPLQKMSEGLKIFVDTENSSNICKNLFITKYICHYNCEIMKLKNLILMVIFMIIIDNILNHGKIILRYRNFNSLHIIFIG